MNSQQTGHHTPHLLTAHFCTGLSNASLHPWTAAWDDMADKLLVHDERDNKDGNGIVWADFTTPHRKRENVAVYHALTLDIEGKAADDLPPAPEVVADRLHALNLEGVVYTSHNHMAAPEINKGKPASPRYRVVVPSSAPILPADLSRHTDALASALKLSAWLDPASRVTSQFFYLPSCRPGAPRFATRTQGEAWNPDDLSIQLANEKHTHMDFTPPPVDGGFDAVKKAAAGRWEGVLSSLGIHVPANGKHGPCPGCGGHDRFRFDNKDGGGSFICSQGGEGTLSGDGFNLVQHVRHCNAADALALVRDVVMPGAGNGRRTGNAGTRKETGEPAANDTPDDEQDINADAVISELAKLSIVDYERRRADEAKRLGMRTAVLDRLVIAERNQAQTAQETAGSGLIFEDVTAWPHAVNGAALLEELTGIIQQYTVLSLEQARAVALWCAFTWFIDAAKVSPMLNITSPEKRCGKSTLLLVVNELVAKPILASNITASALFRCIEAWTPTLLIDETDAFLNEKKEELRGILNAGHYRKTAFVIRTVGDNHEPKKFMTWCAKVLCGIGKIAYTLSDRSIIIELRRKLPTENVANIHNADERVFSVFRQKLKRWQDDNIGQFAELRPERIAGINDRAADNWQPLQAVAALAGGQWPERCKMTATTLSGIEDDAPSINVELLMDIAEIFHNKKTIKMHTADLLTELCADEEKAWFTWNRGKPINAHQISKRLSEFGIKPHDVRIGTLVRKGYELPQFNEAIIRYGTNAGTVAPESATPLQPLQDNAYSQNQKRYNGESVALSKSPKPLQGKECSGVADWEGVEI